MSRRSDRKPPGWFTDARGAERMRQGWARAVAAGASDADLAVLGAVFVFTIGWSKLDDEVTLATLATELGRWERPTLDDDRTEEQIERARARKTERIGASLRKLHDAGALVYSPGKGGRRSFVALPEVDDDQSQPHVSRGVHDEWEDVSTPRGAVLNPTRDGPQPHAARFSTPRATGGTTDRTDRSDRVRSHARDANHARPARSAQAPTTADYDSQPYAELIHDAVGRHYPHKRNPAQPADVLAAARTLEHAYDLWPDQTFATVRHYGQAGTLRKPAEILDHLRELLLAEKVDPDVIADELDDPGPSAATA